MKGTILNIIVITGLAVYIIFSLGACKHSPIVDDMMTDTTDTDTMDNDTMPGDTSEPCDSTVVYFQQEILPIFQSNCATSGCHDSQTAEEGVILNSYDNIINTGDVRPFNLDGSDVYERITEDDEDKRMPPPPASRLSSELVDKISLWILQGAKNNSCEEEECETENMSYSDDIRPILQLNCYSCHSGSSPNAGLDLSQYSVVETISLNGRLLGAVKHQSGYTPMPYQTDMLNDCTIMKIESWVNDGAQNN